MKRKVIIFGLNLFEWPDVINNYDIISIEPIKKLNFWKSLYRGFLIRTKPSKAGAFFNIDLIIRNLNDAEALIVGDGMPYEIINAIVSAVDKANISPNHKIIYLINPARDLSKIHLSDGWSIKTFDYNDHQKWGCQYVSTFHVPVTIPKVDISYDVFFIGKNKGRFKTIKRLEAKITSLGLKCNFLYVSRLYLISKRYSAKLSYAKALSLMASSRAILDISQDGQMGLTQRFMESIFYEKKIITNNDEIKRYKIYNENNIYILSDNNINALEQFLIEPYEKLNPSLISWYDPQHWLKRILSNDREDIDLIE